MRQPNIRKAKPDFHGSIELLQDAPVMMVTLLDAKATRICSMTS